MESFWSAGLQHLVVFFFFFFFFFCHAAYGILQTSQMTQW